MIILIIIILTLLVYSAISTTVYFLTKENDDVAIIFGLGVIGVIIMIIGKITYKVRF